MIENQQAPLASPRERIEASINQLTRHMARDREATQLMDSLGGQACYNNPTKSGLSECDYFKLPLQQILKEVNRTPLPPELVQHFQRMKCQFQTGIFPDIQRAWATVDSDLVIWNYANGRDVVYYDGIESVILAMDLVRPKPNIFRNHVHYLLAVATPSEVTILGVTLAENTQSGDIELHFVNEPLYTYPVENIVVTKIKGARNGRIFLGSQDGSLYELSYFAQRGWLQSLCKLTNCSSRFPLINNLLPSLFRSSDPVTEICVDNARQILYSLSEKGIISVYDLGSDGQEMVYVSCAGEDSLMRSVPDCDSAQIRRVMHIEAVPLNESNQVHLVAFTESGARIYLSTCEPSPLARRPCMLTVLHVRLPFALPHKVTRITGGLIMSGTALMLDQQNENRHSLIALDHFSHFRRANQFIETYSFLVVDRNIWSISVAENPTKQPKQSDMSTKFVMLSHNGCQILSKMTPTEQLRHLLSENRGAVHAGPVKTFFACYNYLEGCVMCLHIICNVDVDPQIQKWACDAFNYYGGEPQVENANIMGGQGFNQPFPQVQQHHPDATQTTFLHPQSPVGSHVMSTPFRAPGYMNNQFPVSPIAPQQQMGDFHQINQMSQQAQSPQPMTGLTTNFQSLNQEFRHSFKHEANFVYFARILKPIYECQLAKESPPHAAESPKLALELTARTLTPVLASLQGLKRFLHSLLNIPENSFALRAQALTATDAMQRKRKAILEEQNSLNNLLFLLTHTMEILNLWKIVADHDIEVISRNMKPELFARIKIITVRDFITCDKQFSSALATAVVDSYLRDGAATSTVSEKLKESCPSVYGNEDALYTKAYEMLTKACDISNKKEREQMLRDALQLCRQISVQALNLSMVCRLLSSARYYEGLVSICLWAAQSIDPQGFAIDFVKQREPQDDDRGRRAYLARKECYNIVTEVLNELYHEGQRQDTLESSGRHYDEILAICIETKDVLFHLCIFDWLVYSGQQEKLLHVRSADLEHYLRRRAENEPNSIATLDLWCRYHELSGKFDKAVNLLLEIANRQGSELNLSVRITYLARAMLCAKSGGPSTSDRLLQLEEILEVAKIQEQIAERLPNESRALNERLMILNELYTDFAEKYRLADCQLLLLQCGSYEDPNLIQHLWASLIEKATECGELPATLKKLCPSFVRSHIFFPLDVIISHCEVKTQMRNYDPLWLPETLNSVGVPWHQLQVKYHELYLKPEMRIIKDRILTVLAGIVSRLAEHPDLMPRERFRDFVQKVANNISTYIVELQSRISDADVGSLMVSFRRSQSVLENIATTYGQH